MFDVAAVKNDFGKSAALYDRHAHLQRVVREHAIALARNYWRGSEQLLDMGCGTGALSHEAALLGLKWNIASLDISPGMCRVALRHSARVVNAGAQCIPLGDARMDGVFSSLMLQWVDTPYGVFSELARILKKGGVAVLSTLVHGTLHELEAAFCAVDDRPHVSRFLHAHALLALAEQAGLSLELARQAVHVEHHPDTVSLMRGLQAIGAANKSAVRKRGLSTARQFSALEAAYRERFAGPQGLPASWHVLYLVVRRK